MTLVLYLVYRLRFYLLFHRYDYKQKPRYHSQRPSDRIRNVYTFGCRKHLEHGHYPSYSERARERQRYNGRGDRTPHTSKCSTRYLHKAAEKIRYHYEREPLLSRRKRFSSLINIKSQKAIAENTVVPSLPSI